MTSRAKVGYLLGGVAIGLVLAGSVMVFTVAWFLDHPRPSKDVRQLVDRCDRRNVTRDQFARTIHTADHRFHADRAAELKEQLKRIHEGMPLTSVLEVAGPPTFAEGSYDKAGTSFDGCYWHYVVSGEVTQNGYFLEDEFYTVRFDGKDRVDLAPIDTDAP